MQASSRQGPAPRRPAVHRRRVQHRPARRAGAGTAHPGDPAAGRRDGLQPGAEASSGPGDPQPGRLRTISWKACWKPRAASGRCGTGGATTRPGSATRTACSRARATSAAGQACAAGCVCDGGVCGRRPRHHAGTPATGPAGPESAGAAARSIRCRPSTPAEATTPASPAGRPARCRLPAGAGDAERPEVGPQSVPPARNSRAGRRRPR